MTDRTIIKIGGGALIAVLVTAMLLAVAVAAGNSPSAEDLEGSWATEDSDGIQFEGTIDADEMTMQMVMDDTSGLYWQGDVAFEEGVLYSNADTEALSMSLLGSGSEAKEFHMDGKETLRFDFSIMGMDQEIEMVKQ